MGKKGMILGVVGSKGVEKGGKGVKRRPSVQATENDYILLCILFITLTLI